MCLSQCLKIFLFQELVTDPQFISESQVFDVVPGKLGKDISFFVDISLRSNTFLYLCSIHCRSEILLVVKRWLNAAVASQSEKWRNQMATAALNTLNNDQWIIQEILPTAENRGKWRTFSRHMPSNTFTGQTMRSVFDVDCLGKLWENFEKDF